MYGASGAVTVMPDGSNLTLPVPPEALARLKRAEARQRNETKARGLTAVPVSVEGLLLIQRFLCGCGCGEPLDFTSEWDEKSPPAGYPVIAHRLARGSRGEHTPRNLGIDRHACNARDAKADTSGAASVKRHTPDMQRKLLQPKDDFPSRDPGKAANGGWGERPQGYVSPLSRKSKFYRKPAWGKRG